MEDKPRYSRISDIIDLAIYISTLNKTCGCINDNKENFRME